MEDYGFISLGKNSRSNIKGKNKLEIFLEKFNEITYIYTAVPTFVLALIGLLTGVLLFVYKSQYFDCKKSDDMLFGFLLGQMIFYYAFSLIYANLLLQIIPYIDSLTVTFILFTTFFTFNTGWSLWGISVLTTTGCPHSVYFGIASFTIAFTLAFDIVLVTSFLVHLFKGIKGNVVPKKSIESANNNQIEDTSNQIPKKKEENKENEKNSKENEKENDWKEEDMEGF